MKNKIKGCTHHDTKVISKYSDGGLVSGGKRLPYMTKKNSDGSQQYVRGETPMDRINTLSEYQDKAYGDSERAYRAGDTAKSNRSLKGAAMLDNAQQEEAKAEMSKRRLIRRKK